MGGSIAVTARRANGEVIRMCRWTNPLPFFIQDARWIDADETHLDEYLEQWNSMRADYEKNEPGNYEFNMTDVYAPYPFLAPHGYGLVVIDYQTHTLLTMQGYSSLIEVFPDTFRNVNPGPLPEDVSPLISMLAMSQEEQAQENARVMGLFKRKCLYVMPRGADNLDAATLVPDLETAQSLVSDKEAWWNYRFFIKPDPWKVRRFPETPDGADEFHDNLIDLGFQFTSQENDLWGEFRNQWEDA